MGHLINPLSLRLSVNTFWNSNWVLINNFNFINVFKKDNLIFLLLNWFINKNKFTQFNILLSHYKLHRVNNNIYVNLYYYNSETNNLKNFYPISHVSKILKQENISLSLTNEQLNNIITSFYTQIFENLLFNFYWKILSLNISFYLNKINSSSKFFLNLYSLNVSNITSEAIASYICLKLQKRYSLNWILRPILKDLNSKVKQNNILGYKIVCAGRFTRKQIATKSWTRGGSIKLNKISNLIKYSAMRVRLKYGICGIKIWLNYGQNAKNLLSRNLFLIKPNYNPFKFSFNTKKQTITLFINFWFYAYLRIISLKLKNFKFYQYFINIKIKIILNNLLNSFLLNSYKYKYKLNIISNNNIQIHYIINNFNYLSAYKMKKKLN